MNAWAYVAAGWGVTGVVIASYWVWIVRRTRAASADLARVEDAS